MDADTELSAAFRVYGDNILECEHFIEWLRRESVSQLHFQSRIGPWDRPIFLFDDNLNGGQTIGFQVCPYYGGTGPAVIWPHNPLKVVFDEKVDVLVTKILDNGEESGPLFAIEFVDAIQAGNQGWQRFRRVINASQASIPFMYVIPVIGWERDSEGLVIKSPRFLPALPCIAQLTLCSRFGVPSIQVYLASSWTAYAREKQYALPNDVDSFRGIDNAVQLGSNLIRNSIRKGNRTTDAIKETYKSTLGEMLSVARTYASSGTTKLPIHANHPALDPAMATEVALVYSDALERKTPVEGKFALHKIGFDDFVMHGELFYKDVQDKTIRPEFRDKVLDSLNWKYTEAPDYKQKYLRGWGIELLSFHGSLDSAATANRACLPLTYKEGKSEAAVVANRSALRVILQMTYPKLGEEMLNWVFSSNRKLGPPLFVIPLYAYKPSGDSRPDRGLLPLLWATFPDLVQQDRTLVLVYSKYTPRNWRQLLASKQNELWTAIATIAGAIIVDRTGDGELLGSQKLEAKPGV